MEQKSKRESLPRYVQITRRAGIKGISAIINVLSVFFFGIVVVFCVKGIDVVRVVFFIVRFLIIRNKLRIFFIKNLL